MSSNNYFACDYCGNLQSLEDPGVTSFAILDYGNFDCCEFCEDKALNLLKRATTSEGDLIYLPRPEFIQHMEQQLRKEMNRLKRRYQMLQEINPYVPSKRQKENSNEQENNRLFIRIRKQAQ